MSCEGSRYVLGRVSWRSAVGSDRGLLLCLFRAFAFRVSRTCHCARDQLSRLFTGCCPSITLAEISTNECAIFIPLVLMRRSAQSSARLLPSALYIARLKSSESTIPVSSHLFAHKYGCQAIRRFVNSYHCCSCLRDRRLGYAMPSSHYLYFPSVNSISQVNAVVSVGQVRLNKTL